MREARHRRDQRDMGRPRLSPAGWMVLALVVAVVAFVLVLLHQ